MLVENKATYYNGKKYYCQQGEKEETNEVYFIKKYNLTKHFCQLK